MKIAVYSQVPPPVHGSTVVTAQLIESLRADGHSVSLLDRRFSRSADEVGVVSVAKLLAAFTLWARATRIAANRPDVVIFFGTNRLGSFLVDVVVSQIFAIAGIPIVQYLHTVGFERLASRNRAQRYLVRHFLKQADRIVCLAPSIGRDVQSSGHNHIRVIENCVQPLEAQPRRAAGKFVFLANLIPAKGAMDIVKVAEELLPSHPDFKFEIYGYPADPEFLAALLEAIRELPNVTYEGPVEDEIQKSRVLGSSTALLYPSQYEFEAQPLAIIEAMSLGTPTIAYDVGAIGELLERGTCGVLCSSPQELARATARIADATSTEWVTLSERARRRYEDHHTPDAFRRKWNAIVGIYSRETSRAAA